MILAVDIGNTNFKLSLFNDSINFEEFSIFHNFSEVKNYLNKKNIDEILISSVNKKKLFQIKNFSIKNKNIHPIIIDINFPFSFKINYKNPNTIGIDRLCGIEGALFLESKNKKNSNKINKQILITIDCGTATTINILDSNNIFIGGIIAPGIETMFYSLNKKTDNLPLVQYLDYENVIGTDTKTSIASGVINSNIGLIELVLNFIKKKYYNEKINIYLTGGNSIILKQYLTNIKNIKWIPELTTLGIIKVYFNLKNKKH